MIIRCFGSRGSVPVSGQPFLTYGGDTTCIEIKTSDNQVIIIDAGTGICTAGNQLQQDNQDSCHLLFTHLHLDHIIGFPFFDLLYSGTSKITIYSSVYLKKPIKSALSTIMNPPYFPFSFQKIKAKLSFQKIQDDTFTIGSACISTIQLNHPAGGIGFKIREKDKCFVFLTDNELGEPYKNGHSFQTYRDFTSQADLLMHDAEFTPEEYNNRKHWGHTSYMDALYLALESGVKRFGLFHHHQQRTDAQIDAMVEKCRKYAARTQSSVHCFAVASGFKIKL
ncbi:MAG: MBL fold metallo-hydrolase [bacterium]